MVSVVVSGLVYCAPFILISASSGPFVMRFTRFLSRLSVKPPVGFSRWYRRQQRHCSHHLYTLCLTCQGRDPFSNSPLTLFISGPYHCFAKGFLRVLRISRLLAASVKFFLLSFVVLVFMFFSFPALVISKLCISETYMMCSIVSRRCLRLVMGISSGTEPPKELISNSAQLSQLTQRPIQKAPKGPLITFLKYAGSP